MHVSEGHLTHQYICDYLTELDTSADIHEQLVLQSMFLRRMSVDGGFHARVVSSILGHEQDRNLLLSLLAEYATETIPETTLGEWLAYAYKDAVQSGDAKRKASVSYLLRSHLAGINKTADLAAAAASTVPESVWRMRGRRFIITEIKNPEMFFDTGAAQPAGLFPLDYAAAYLAGVAGMDKDRIYDAVICVAAAWFSTLLRDEMIVWINMPRTGPEQWGEILRPLLDLADPEPAIEAANWLYCVGNFDAALDLYANITLAYAKTPAEKPAFEMMGEILREFGDFDNAFEAYKNAFLLSRNESKYTIACGLKNLCLAGDSLGEDMHEYYTRISKLTAELPADERQSLEFALASAARKNHNYSEEYTHLEQIIDGPNGNETFFAAAIDRITEINTYLDENGNPNTTALAQIDDEKKADEYVLSGDAALHAFDPVGALYWYNRAVTLYPPGKTQVDDKLFAASVSAGLVPEAAARARGIPAREAVIHALSPDGFMAAVQSLTRAIDDTRPKTADRLIAIIEPVFIRLSAEKRVEAARFITQNRSTRENEKAVVSLAAGSVCLDLGMADEARALLRAALRANPDNDLRSRILIELAWMEGEGGLYAEARETYRAALKQNEMFPAAWAGLAKVSIYLGNYQEAYAAIEKAVILNPADVTFQQTKTALANIIQAPANPAADMLFAMPARDTTPYAAALYAEDARGDTVAAWNAKTVEDVLKYR